MIERYYNLFDPAKHYTQLLFRAGDGLQSRELNEIQSTLMHRLQGVADALLKDGDIVSGANLQIDADTGVSPASVAPTEAARRESAASSGVGPSSHSIDSNQAWTQRPRSAAVPGSLRSDSPASMGVWLWPIADGVRRWRRRSPSIGAGRGVCLVGWTGVCRGAGASVRGSSRGAGVSWPSAQSNVPGAAAASGTNAAWTTPASDWGIVTPSALVTGRGSMTTSSPWRARVIAT